MTDTLIKVENVSKKFCRSLKRSLLYGMQDLGSELLGRRHGGNGELRDQEFWAVRDLSFEVKRGECLGLIGGNGAGKTTLLRMLNGLVKPDAGSIEMRGRVGALIALGAGFNPVLTGRENIYVNAALLGLNKHEINKKFDEIVAFSNLGDFIDSPVQHYSSGMYVRLGFSIAAHIHPDILLVDEALAVGDVAFVIKCLNKIADLRKEGTAIIFVSHTELQVREAASRCLVMAKGQLIGDTDIDQAFFLYQQSSNQSGLRDHTDAGFVHDGPIHIDACTIDPAPCGIPTPAEPLRILIECESAINVADACFELRFWNSKEQLVTSIKSVAEKNSLEIFPGRNIIAIDIPSLALVPGRYRLASGFRKNGEILGWTRDLANFDVTTPRDAIACDGAFITPAHISSIKNT
jgi:ABC-type polysaccharide/polyol phosphate transport system ATPase subunit